jgi:hypothetical protein
MLAVVVLGMLASGESAKPAAVPRLLGPWRIGIWMEARPDVDSLTQRRWADSVVSDFSHRLAPTASAGLFRFQLLRNGALPLAGGDARHHPDLRATDLDAAWGVPSTDPLDATTAQRAQRAWLAARGCPDERNFGVGWDLFELPHDSANRLSPRSFVPDSQNNVYTPRWRQLPDSGLDAVCRAILQRRREGGLELFSTAVLERSLRESLPTHLAVGVLDDGNRPAIGASLEIWRGIPDPRRPFANRLAGKPAIYHADSLGRFPLANGLAWFAKDSLVFSPQGSNAISYWRLRLGKKSLQGWMDAVELANLPRRQGWAEQYWRLPSGSSRPWQEASGRWPQPWLAAEADASGVLTMGLSVPVETDFVLRILDARGREKLRTRPIHLPRGVHERSMKVSLPPGWWDVRLDTPLDRFQVRVEFPAPAAASDSAPGREAGPTSAR